MGQKRYGSYLTAGITYWAGEVARLTAEMPDIRAEWELAELDWALQLGGAGPALDIARNNYNMLHEDLRFAQDKLAGFIAEKEARKRRRKPSGSVNRGVPVPVQPDGGSAVAVRITPDHDAGTWDLSFECSWCPAKRGKPQRHLHGGGPLTDAPMLGSRVSHCPAEGAPDRDDLIDESADYQPGH